MSRKPERAKPDRASAPESPGAPLPGWMEAYYRVLLRLYPVSFRRRFGSEMKTHFRHLAADRLSRRGRLRGGLGVLWRMTSDSLRGAARLHWSGRRGQPSSASGRSPGTRTGWLGDIRYSLRSLRRRPLWTLSILLLLALGIGANAAIFSTARSILHAPLPFPGSERLMLVENLHEGRTGPQVAYQDFQDIVEQTPSLESGGLALWYAGTLQHHQRAERLDGFQVTPGFFRALAADFALGSNFSDQEAARDQTVIISHRLWQSRFGGTPDILGREVVIDGRPRSVIGVLAPGVDLPYPRSGNDLWLPLNRDHQLAQSRAVFTFFAFVRLRPGASLEALRQELRTVALRLQEAYPETNAGRFYVARPLLEAAVGDVRPSLWLLYAAVTVLLLLVCANVANLLLARFSVRRHEVALRAALGAGRWRLMAQFLWESLLLSASGAAAGLLLALGLVRLLPLLAPPGVPRLEEVALSSDVLLYACALALLTGLVFGLAPAWKAGRTQARRSLAQAHPRGSGGASGGLRSGLVVAELALALTLTVAAGLLLTSMAQVLNQPPGFRVDSTLTWRLSLPPDQYPDFASILDFQRRLAEGIESLPGARRLAFSTSLPLSGHDTGSSLTIEGRPAVPIAELPSVRWQAISPGGFRAAGIQLLEGRTFGPADLGTQSVRSSNSQGSNSQGAGSDSSDENSQERHLVVVNRALAERHFPEGAIGQRIQLGIPNGDWHEIVGVVGDVRHRTLDQAPDPRAYDLFGQHGSRSFFALLQTDVPAASLADAVRAEVGGLDPMLPAYDLRSMRERVTDSLSGRRFLLTLLGGFALLALVLCAIGVYGLLAFVVQERRGEIGIRLALGARPEDVRRLMLGRGAWLAVAGILLGLPALWAASRYLAGRLYQVSAGDPVIVALSCLLLLVVALTATYFPARRASLLDPQETLRE
ncbi:MAG TPA: ADOP family duplicated permease [Acidobacteriota bacterium]|nr:ADOP family duplicated permease [Acidobacteriota bacterium]